MKKIFIVSILCIVFYSSIYAQEKTLKYQGEVTIGASSTFNSNANYLITVPVEMINGFRYGEHFFVGVGIGFNFLVGGGISHSAYTLPLFLNMKGYLPFSEKTFLLLSCDVGGKFGVSGMLGINDFIARPAVGVSLLSPNKRFAHNITIGYDFDKMITHVSGVKAYSNLSALSLRYGFQF